MVKYCCDIEDGWKSQTNLKSKLGNWSKPDVFDWLVARYSSELHDGRTLEAFSLVVLD